MSAPDELRRRLMPMASEIREIARAETEKSAHEELQREALSAFIFGMMTAAGKAEGLPSAELHELIAACLNEALRYFPEEAEQLVRELISAAGDAAGGGTAGAVIRRGVEGYELWKNHDIGPLRADLIQLLDFLETRELAEGRPDSSIHSAAGRNQKSNLATDQHG